MSNVKTTTQRLKLFSFTLLLCISALTLFVSPAFAQDASSSSTHSTFQESKPTSFTSKESGPTFEVSTVPLPATVSPTSPLYTDLLVSNLFHSFSCLAVGQSMIGQPCLTYQFSKNAQGMLQGIPVLSQVNLSGGTLGAVTGVIGALYQNPPVRTADYLASISGNFGVVREANAQVVGSGAAVLNPILSLWQVSRNISYVIMIVIFVIIGLMVMFRNKLNPQTVITAQAALPGLVIGLILITFSYFLAGLITDMAFVGVNAVGYYFSTAQQPGATPKLAQDINFANVGTIFSKYVGMLGSGDIAGMINSILSSLDGGVATWVRLFAGILGFQAGASFGGPIGSMGGPAICAATGIGTLAIPLCGAVGQLAGGVLGGTIIGAATFGAPAETFGLLFYFVAVAVLIYTMIKLLLKLITTYLSIIFLTITAPFQLLLASLPGRQGIATGWILSMLANILAFPAVFAVFYFVAYLLGPTFASGQFFNINEPHNLTRGTTLPLLGGLDLKFINLLVAFGALLATPSIPDIISRALGKFSQAGQLIGQEISGSTRFGQGYAGRFGAVPGQTMQGLSPLKELGPQYTTVMGNLGPVIIKTPGFLGRQAGQGPKPV